MKRIVLVVGVGRSGTSLLAGALGQLGFHIPQPEVTADETNPKPHPAMLLELMAELEIPAEGALMIGDTSHDLEMARAAGVDALAVTYGAHAEEGLRSCQPRACVASVPELDRWLMQHG